MLCSLRSAMGFNCECPYDVEMCKYNFYEEGDFMYEYCPLDVDDEGFCMAVRLNMKTHESDMVLVELVIWKNKNLLERKNVISVMLQRIWKDTI